MTEELLSLKKKYSKDYKKENLRNKVLNMYTKYLKQKEEAILDATVLAAGLTIEIIQDANDPMVIEAFERQFPTMNINDLSSLSDTQLDGIVNGIKGKYFEILVADKLNSGEVLGNIALSEGQTAVLSDNPAEVGWDLRIVDEEGNTIEFLQAKATNSLAYIKEHILENPDIKIVATDEIADRINSIAENTVLDSNISNAEISEKVSDEVADLSDSFWGELLDHFNPLIPIGIIAVTEGKNVIAGKYSIGQGLNKAKKRGLKSGAALGVGSVLAALDFGIVSIPASFFTRLGLDRFENFEILETYISKSNRALGQTNTQYLLNN